MQAAKAAIEKKHGAWLAKHCSKKATTAKAPATPKPVSQAPEPAVPPTFTKKGSEFEAADAAWADKTPKPGSLKYDGKAQVGGAHVKEFWTDEAGERWLFKPAERQDGLHPEVADRSQEGDRLRRRQSGRN